jgi:hypothetical protein
MFKSIFANSLHKRLFKLTENYGWLRKFAEGSTESKPSLVINLPTIGEFLASLAVEGNVETTSEDDEKQAKLNHAVAVALDAFYKTNLDLSQTAFASWKFGDVSSSLVKGLSFLDADDLSEIKAAAIQNAEDAEIKDIINSNGKLADAVKYVLTRAYLHSYTIMVAQNPAIAVLNLMQTINDQDIPLSLNVSQKSDGKIVATAAKKKDSDFEESEDESEKEAKFKVDTPRGPRLSDWIRSLRISRAQTLTSLQRELEKKQPRETAVSTYKVQYLILSSHIAHLENIATAWKDLVKNDEYKASRLGSVFIMDDPPIGNLLKQEPSSISALSGFLPPSIYETFGLNSSKIFVKKWDGTLFSSLAKDDVADLGYGEGLQPAFDELSALMQDTIANLPDSSELRLLKQKLIKYNSTSKTMMNSITNLMGTADDKKSRAQLFKLMREFKDDIQAVSIILVDLNKIHGYDLDPDKVLELSKSITDALPRGRENALNFIPSAAFIKQVYLPSVTTKPTFHTDMYAEAIRDAKEALEFGANSIPSFSPAQRAAIVSAMGLTIAQAEALAREIYREGFARILAILSAVPEESLKNVNETTVSKITAMYNSSLNTLKSDLYSKLSSKMPKTTTPEVFEQITSSIWSQLPKLGGSTVQTDLSNIIKQIGGSAIVARTEGGSAQDFNDVYSKVFIKRQKPESDSLQGSALHAVERLTSDYFYKFYDEHAKKHDAWQDSYSPLDAGEEAQEVRKGLIRTHYDKILKSNVLDKLGFKMPRGGSLVNHQNPVNPKKDEARQQYLANVQKFLNQHKTLDSLYSKIDALDADVSMESVLVYIGVELIEAFEPELILHLANSYPKVVIRGVEMGFGYAEKGAEDETAGMYGSNVVGTLTYRDLNSNIPSIEYARAFIDKFKQDLRFNSRAIGQLHPYTPGGMIADIYYMEERISKLPNENAKTRRAADINRFRTDPLSLLGYMKKRLFDSYGKAIYDRNNDQLNRMLVSAAKNSDKPDVAKNIKQFMQKVGAFADPEWSIKNAGSKANYRYIEGVGDSASAHLQRAFNRVGQISALANNYDTIFVVYKSYFDNRKEELLRTKDKEGRSIWKDYIIPFDLSREKETNRPFTGKLQELANLAATAMADKMKPATEEASSVEQDEPTAGDIPLEDTDTVSLLITDRRSAMEAIGSLKTSIISDIDKSLIKGIVSNLGRKDPKVYSNSAVFMKMLIEEIRKESALGNRDEVASYFESYVSIVAEQAQVAAPVIKAIQAQEEISGSSDMASLKLNGEGLIRTNIPTGYSNMEYLKQKLQYTIDSIDYWMQDYQDASLKYNLDDYPATIKAVVGGAGKNFDQFKAEFDRLTDSQKKMFNTPTFGAYVAYYRLYVEAKPIIEAEESYPDFVEFLEMQDDYLQNFPQLGEKLQEYVNEYKSVSLAMFKEAADLVLMKPKIDAVKNSFVQKLTELDKVVSMDPASAAAKQAAEKWKGDMQEAVQRHKKELGAPEFGNLPLSDTNVVVEEPVDVSQEDLEEVTPEDVKEVQETTPEVSSQFDGIKSIAENLAEMVSNDQLIDWLDIHAPSQKSEIIGNISNLADTLSKLNESSFDSIDKLPRFEQSIGEVVSKVRSNFSLLPQIFSDKYMKRLIEISSKTLGVNLSEMPLSFKAPQPIVEAPPTKPTVNIDQFKSALTTLVEKVRAVEGNVNDMTASQDMLEQLTGNSLSAEQATAIISNTKMLLEYLSSLTENDFTDQNGVDSLVKQLMVPLANRSDQDFIKFFAPDKFIKLFDAVKSKFGITKQPSQKISNTSSINKVAVYNISISDDADDGYYF